VSLHAFFTSNGTTTDADKLTKYGQQHLPKTMAVASYTQVEEFPSLASGKINYQKLLETLNTRQITKPTNDIETKLLGILQGVTGRLEISTSDKFSTMGVNSLTMIKITSIIHRELDIKVSLKEFLENFTIVKLGELLQLKSINTNEQLAHEISFDF